MPNFKVKITQESEISSSASYSASEIDRTRITLQRTIYNNLKSLIKNEDVYIPLDKSGTGNIQFLEAMSILHDILILGLPVEMPPGVDSIDEYLGLLGLDEKYPMKKDIIHLKKFLNADYTPNEEG
ncbi:MAG: hypothetical protein DRH37_07415 [Deltaproteobacteria bacterium]|nr:MAG: hypothetical protein DRH37_07415 [Deltaproteobacteria bacterium]